MVNDKIFCTPVEWGYLLNFCLRLDQCTRVYCELRRRWAHGGDTRIQSAMQAFVGGQLLW